MKDKFTNDIQQNVKIVKVDDDSSDDTIDENIIDKSFEKFDQDLEEFNEDIE